MLRRHRAHAPPRSVSEATPSSSGPVGISSTTAPPLPQSSSTAGNTAIISGNRATRASLLDDDDSDVLPSQQQRQQQAGLPQQQPRVAMGTVLAPARPTLWMQTGASPAKAVGVLASPESYPNSFPPRIPTATANSTSTPAAAPAAAIEMNSSLTSGSAVQNPTSQGSVSDRQRVAIGMAVSDGRVILQAPLQRTVSESSANLYTLPRNIVPNSMVGANPPTSSHLQPIPSHLSNSLGATTAVDEEMSVDSTVRRARESMRNFEHSTSRGQLLKPEDPPPPTVAMPLVEPSVSAAKTSRRYLDRIDRYRHSDLASGLPWNVGGPSGVRGGYAIDRRSMVVVCESCQRPWVVPKATVMLQCLLCEAVSPASSARIAN